MLRQDSDAQDALQEVFWSVWNKAGTYDPALGAPAAWIMAMARSRAIDLMRKSARTAALERPRASEVHVPPASAELPPKVAALIAELPAEQGAAVALAFYRGLTREQIAAAQDVPVGTVKTRIRSGLKRVREAIQPASGPTP
jgi:RNA polymerase sigma-70 factor (ECF subfamily)